MIFSNAETDHNYCHRKHSGGKHPMDWQKRETPRRYTVEAPVAITTSVASSYYGAVEWGLPVQMRCGRRANVEAQKLADH